MVDPRLLELLVCPETKQSLQLASNDLLQSVNQQIASGTAVNRKGHRLVAPLGALLVREDGEFGYPVLEDIPVMLVDEAIPLVNR